MPRAPEIVQRATALSAKETANLRVFDTVWDLVNRKFYDPKFHGAAWPAAALSYGPQAMAAVDDDQLYGVINRMLAELKESHNWASSPAAVEAQLDHPQSRIGIIAGQLDGRWIILAVLPDSPAALAGVKRGWILVSRNGRPIGLDESLKLKDGDTVTDVYLDPEEQSHTLSLTARPLRAAVWREARELEGGAWYLRFDDFNQASRRWLREQLKAYRQAPAVVVDLRQNHGGSAFSLGIVLGEFFSKSVEWGRFTGRSGWVHKVGSWQWGSARYAGKVAVLVGGDSASSAEIFAHVLQAQKRAVIVGRKTAGAVLGSYIYGLPDGGELQLGVFDFQGSEGQRLEGVGVLPDIVVTSPYDGIDGLRRDHDLDLEAALTALQSDASSAAPSSQDSR